MRRWAWATVAAAGASVVLTPRPALAHPIGGRSDLPVPVSFFIVGASVALVVSFVLLSVLWVTPRLQDGPRVRPIRSGWAEPVFGVLQVAGVVGLVLVVAAGLFGSANGSRNVAPVLVWVYFWLLIPFVGVVAGNVWTAINPWRTLPSVFGWRSRERPEALVRWGIWPAAAAFIAFTWLELVYQSGSPSTLAVAALVYTVFLVGAMLWLGPATGLQVADAFTSYNRLLSGIAPFGRTEHGQLTYRGWLRALPVLPLWRGLTVFVVAMIGTVTYDGLSGTPLWRNLVGDLAFSQWFGTLALLGTVTVIGAGYWLASYVAVMLSGERSRSVGDVARRFAHTLVPIAFAYAFAHYFTLVIFEGQGLIPTLSDPFGVGWDLFGTAGYRINYQLLSPQEVWAVQVAAIVVGHVLGVILAHDRALAEFPATTAVRTQYAMLGLMILLTSLGLAILAAG